GGTAVVLAGAGARTAGVPLALVIALAAAGMTAGAGVDYALGRAGVARLLRHPRAGRLGRRLADQLEQAAPLLQRHGWWMMLVAHAFGHGRSSLAVAAGASRLPLKRFFAIEVPAAILWGGLYAGGGYYLAAEWGRVELALRRAGWVGAALLIVSALVWWLQQRALRRGPPAPGDGKPDPATHTPPVPAPLLPP
ncbi:MAG TPA: VTT domain-containing protein, partial [Chloroflexota bacterium]|nr:VTT domain-containing protein [Chloroflexota bacterium]